MRDNPPPFRAALSIPEVIEATGLSRQTVYNEINRGRLKSLKVGARRLVSPESLRAWVKDLEKSAA